MKIWISKNSEVSIREQIVTQISVGIASGDIEAGERIPSTREMARRFGIHPNTVSSAYRELASAGILTVRRGSGIFAASAAHENGHPNDVDRWLSDLVSSAAAAGFSRSQVRSAMKRLLEDTEAPEVLLFEPDPELREIILQELTTSLGRRPVAVGTKEVSAQRSSKPCIFTALFDKREKILELLPASQRVVFLAFNSVTASLGNAVKPANSDLIAIVSGWEKFISFARVYLLAAQIEPDRLIVRSSLQPGWKRGLDSASIVVCDVHTASRLPNDPRLRVFHLIQEESLAELRYCLG